MNAQKTAVVTGASRGIGLCIADSLENAGYAVVRASRSGDPPCDIGEASDRERLLKYVLNKHGRVDLLVNNAGIAPAVRADLLETTLNSFRTVLRTNLEGTFFMCQLFADQMRKQPRENPCRIINISSISAYTSSTKRGEYCVSKAGVSMVTQLFADRLAEYGIGVFEIRPGIIETDMIAKAKDDYERRIVNGLTPVKRLGQPQDVADIVLAIASGAFDFATGQVFNADGGFHLRRL
ncbi:MAG: 3-ketoacyl-ACP reductase [Defluviitaleaceae bacterium]|nr:3-ketoacyl-ACP reductase [Defluviitaleaceae bacterium]